MSEELTSCTLTPLMAAAQCGHVEVVQELVTAKAGLDVKLKATQWTALMFAILNNRVSHMPWPNRSPCVVMAGGCGRAAAEEWGGAKGGGH